MSCKNRKSEVPPPPIEAHAPAGGQTSEQRKQTLNVQRPTSNVQCRRRQRKEKDESVALLFLRCVATGSGVDDRAARQFFAQHRVDLARLDTGGHSCLPGC